MRIPRKKKKKVPVGPYCYTPLTGYKILPNGKYGFEAKLCDFYTCIRIEDVPEHLRPRWMDQEYVDEFKNEQIGWCRLVKEDVEDQCKSCGLRK